MMKRLLLIILMIFTSSSCTIIHKIEPTQAATETVFTFPTNTIEPTQTSTFTRTPTATLTSTPTLHSTITATFTITPYPELEGCVKPPEDYTLVNINGNILNQRTYAMLEQAALIYDGELDILGHGITQGSYTNEVDASFGTHAGGGAVDISVLAETHFEILWDEIPPLIEALRIAGFAAWYRDVDQLYPGSPVHIHAIAIGDQYMSKAAYAQLVGDFGYFRGYNGLPQYDGEPLDEPIPDEHGGPIICQWMLDLEYEDLR